MVWSFKNAHFSQSMALPHFLLPGGNHGYLPGLAQLRQPQLGSWTQPVMQSGHPQVGVLRSLRRTGTSGGLSFRSWLARRAGNPRMPCPGPRPAWGEAPWASWWRGRAGGGGWRWSRAFHSEAWPPRWGVEGPRVNARWAGAKARLFSPFTVLGPSSAGGGEGARVAMHQGQSPASPRPGAGPPGSPGILAEEESGMMGLAHPSSPCCLASPRPSCTVTLGPFLQTRSQLWGLTPAVSPTT